MDFNVFINVIKASVEEMLPDCEITIRDVVKNNNVILSAISIKSENVNAAPTIYLEQFYEEYRKGTDIRSITDRIVEIYEINKLCSDYDFKDIEEYDKAKRNIYFKAVNYMNNSDFLTDVPYYLFEDLALVPYYLINDEVIGEASVVIHNDLFESWNIDSNVFYNDIMENMENHFEYAFQPITDVLSKLSDGMLPDNLSSMGMYVLYPENKLYGAALIAVCSVLRNIAEMLRSNYYIIPSSVHELIIVKSDDENDRDILNGIVEEVNNTALSPEDILAGHVYYYKRGLGITH